MISLPPYTSHHLQRLDVPFMGLLGTYYARMYKFCRSVQIGDVVKLFDKVFKSAVIYKINENGFKATRIVSFKSKNIYESA